MFTAKFKNRERGESKVLNLKSWSQEHPREPLLLLVVLCSVLVGYVYTASPEPHYDHSAQVKSTARKTLPTAGPLLVEAPVRGRTLTPVGVALSDDSGKRKCSKQGGWWIAAGDEGLFWTKKQCENYKQRKELEKSKPYWIPSLNDNELYPEPTFHPNPNDYWM